MRTLTQYALAGLCVFGLSLAGCSSRTDPVSAAPKMTDSEMENSIEARWASNPAFNDLKISAHAKENEATVSGSVATEDLRADAVNLAKGASPGLVVTDKIDVKPHELSRSEYTEEMAREAREHGKSMGDKIGNSIEDAWIHTKITAKLVKDNETPSHKINVDVDDQVVTLRGTVKSTAAKAETERIAKETDGVKRVVNLLKVSLS